MRFLICLVILLGLSDLGIAQMYSERESWVTRYLDAGGDIRNITGAKKPKRWRKEGRFDNLKANPDLPKEFNWNDYYQLQPIRNQGSCGSCWFFSITAVVESLYFIKNEFADNSWYDLAEQTGVSSCEKGGDCGGGWMSAFQFVKDQGIPHENDDPYLAHNSSCKGAKALQKIVEWKYIGDEGKSPTVEQLKTAIYQYGPISVDINASFGSYGEGIFDNCNSSITNHMQDIEGWHDDEALSANGGGYWIVRNSWGSSWGEKGYIRIVYKGKNGRKCNSIGSAAAYAVIDGLEASADKPLGARALAKGLRK